MNSLIKGTHTLKKFFLDSTDAFFGRTIEDILTNNFFNSFDVNIREEEHTYIMEIGVPGMTRKDVSIRVDGQVMWISAERQQQSTLWRSREFSSTRLNRTFTLPADADTNNMHAKCRNGLLTIQIPKVKAKGTHRVIRISDDERRLTIYNNVTSWWSRLIDRAQRFLGKKHS